jgi:hypothetical protein
VRGTIAAVERELLVDGFVLPYLPEGVDGLPGTEGVFLPCYFWFADCVHLIGRRKEAHEAFERLLASRNDVGLLSEEYDPKAKRLLGNFPQAFSHAGLVNTTDVLMPATTVRQTPAAQSLGRPGLIEGNSICRGSWGVPFRGSPEKIEQFDERDPLGISLAAHNCGVVTGN